MRRRSLFKLLLGTAVLAIAERVPSFALPAPAVPQRVADSAITYIRQRLSEESFARKILGPVSVCRHEVGHS